MSRYLCATFALFVLLTAGIVLGQRTRLPAEMKDDFAATGTTHILASSGMNVGIVAALVFWLTQLVRIRRSRAIWLAAGGRVPRD